MAGVTLNWASECFANGEFQEPFCGALVMFLACFSTFTANILTTLVPFLKVILGGERNSPGILSGEELIEIPAWLR